MHLPQKVSEFHETINDSVVTKCHIKVWLWPRLTFQWAAPSKWYSRWVLLDRLILAVRHGDTGDMWKALESIKCDQWWHASAIVLFFFKILSGVGYVVATSRCSVWQYPLHSWLGISFLRRCRNSGFAEWLCEGYVAFAEWFYSRQQLKLCTRTSMNVTTRIISQYLTISYMHSLSCLQQCFVMFTTQHCRLGTVKLRGDFCTACHCGPANHPNEHKECSTTADSIGTTKILFVRY